VFGPYLPSLSTSRRIEAGIVYFFFPSAPKNPSLSQLLLSSPSLFAPEILPPRASRRGIFPPLFFFSWTFEPTNFGCFCFPPPYIFPRFSDAALLHSMSLPRCSGWFPVSSLPEVDTFPPEIAVGFSALPLFAPGSPLDPGRLRLQWRAVLLPLAF